MGNLHLWRTNLVNYCDLFLSSFHVQIHLKPEPINEPGVSPVGVSQFKSDSLIFRITQSPATMQTLDLKVNPNPGEWAYFIIFGLDEERWVWKPFASFRGNCRIMFSYARQGKQSLHPCSRNLVRSACCYGCCFLFWFCHQFLANQVSRLFYFKPISAVVWKHIQPF